MLRRCHLSCNHIPLPEQLLARAKWGDRAPCALPGYATDNSGGGGVGGTYFAVLSILLASYLAGENKLLNAGMTVVVKLATIESYMWST